MYFPEVQPVLEATYRLLSEHDSVSPDQVVAELGDETDPDHVRRALAQLYRERYIGGLTIEEQAYPYSIYGTEKGLQEAAGWPRDGAADVQTFLRLLDDRIAREDTSEEDLGHLRRIRETVSGASSRVIGEVLGRYLAEMT